MPLTKDIRAGRAFVELFTDDRSELHCNGRPGGQIGRVHGWENHREEGHSPIVPGLRDAALS